MEALCTLVITWNALFTGSHLKSACIKQMSPYEISVRHPGSIKKSSLTLKLQ